MTVDDILDEYAEQLTTFHYSKSRTREILTEMLDRCNSKLNLFAVSNHVSADLYEWSDTNMEGDITKNDCDKLVDWFSRNCC